MIKRTKFGKTLNIWLYNTSWSYFLAVIFIITSTGILLIFREHLEKAHMGILYLLAITGVAALGGTRPALLAALFGFFSWNFFFLQPYHTFFIQDARDWFLLITFLVIGTIVGQITGNLKKRESEALAREKETTVLYNAALSLNTETRFEDVIGLLLTRVQQSIKASTCAILRVKDDDTPVLLTVSGATDVLSMQHTRSMTVWVWKNAKSIGLNNISITDDQVSVSLPVDMDHSQVSSFDVDHNNDVFIPLSIKGNNLGVLFAIPEKGKRFGSTDCRLLVTFSEIIATFLERNRLIEEAAKVAALKESEHLKSILFSSISHNLKNPLVSLTASLESLLQEDIVKSDMIYEHLLVMAEDIHCLRENIENLLSLAQLESGLWKPHQDWYDLREIISIALRQLAERDFNRINIVLPDEFFLVWVDSVQMSQVMRHIVENALAFSPTNSEVKIEAKADNQALYFWIDDKGPGVSVEVREKIFEKFSHKGTRDAMYGKGTGLGLAICKEIVQAHNGQITVLDAPEGGARFLVTLPVKSFEERML